MQVVSSVAMGTKTTASALATRVEIDYPGTLDRKQQFQLGNN